MSRCFILEMQFCRVGHQRELESYLLPCLSKAAKRQSSIHFPAWQHLHVNRPPIAANLPLRQHLHLLQRDFSKGSIWDLNYLQILRQSYPRLFHKVLLQDCSKATLLQLWHLSLLSAYNNIIKPQQTSLTGRESDLPILP